MTIAFSHRPFLLGGLMFLLGLFSCQKEKTDLVENRAPVVRIAIDSIQLPDSIRLNTRVHMHWSGIDADGYVKGFKIAWDTNLELAKQKLAAAALVQNTDSIILFSFSGGQDDADIYFVVQAVDNKDLASLEPAFLKIPVKNSKPVVSFQEDGLPLADTIWSVLSLPYQVQDPDGEDNLDSVLIRLNSGPWVSVPLNLRFITLVPSDPAALGITEGLLYAGENLSSLNNEPTPLSGIRLQDLRLNDFNTIYLKAKDQAGSEAIDTLPKPYYFRRKTSNLLLVDAYKGEGAFLGDTMYNNILSGFTSFDRIDMVSGNGANQPLFWNASFYLLCKQYKSVFWYSDILTNLPGQNPLLLTSAASALVQYLRFNGKLLASVIFPDAPNQMSIDDPVFSLLPIASVSEQSNIIRLRRNVPVTAWKAGYSDLKSTNNLITGVDIFSVRPGVDTLYLMPKESLTNTYTGPSLPIALKTKNPFNNRTNLVFFGMELTYLSGDRAALTNTFSTILTNEFNW
jgi:hypothetical protein